MAIRYTVTCDGCGRIIATSTISARAARGDAQLRHGANHGPDGDHCESCRRKRVKQLSDKAKAAGYMPHRIGVPRRD